MRRVVIVLEGGLVADVYSDDRDVSVQIIDRDTDDPVQEAESDKAIKELADEIRHKKMKHIY